MSASEHIGNLFIAYFEAQIAADKYSGDSLREQRELNKKTTATYNALCMAAIKNRR